LPRVSSAEQRAFWFGFALFGCGFFLFGFGPWTNMQDLEYGDQNGPADPKLITCRLTALIIMHLRADTSDMEAVGKITANTLGIAHLLVSLAMAVCGGAIAVWMHGRRRRSPQKPSPRPGRSDVIGAAILVFAGLFGVSMLGSWYDSVSPRGPYFPPSIVGDRRQGLSEFVVDWYSRALRAMKEPSLWGQSRTSRNIVAYRVILLPTFDHPRAVRIERTSAGATLRGVVLTGLAGYDPGQVAIEKNVLLDNGEWSKVESRLAGIGFWTMPTADPAEGGCDGEQLMLEGVANQEYHLGDRWSPEGDYADVCYDILRLSGIQSLFPPPPSEGDPTVN
jgi:hypothetical protein